MKNITIMVSWLLVVSCGALGQGICSKFKPVPGRCSLSAPEKEQAQCLLRPVKKFADLGAPLQSLPSPLEGLIGQPTGESLTRERLSAYLRQKGISEQDVGGSLSIPLTKPKYFVIHDTSDFLGDLGSFPADINQETWAPNNLARRVRSKVCHVYINRLGQSATAIPFESATPPGGTKFSSCHSSQRAAFLYIENIQPRIKDRSVRFKNDAIAPDPGFTDSQMKRLALVYIVASVRSGKCIIPTYHSPIDLGYPNRHDDPQRFDLDKWAENLTTLLNEIRASN